MTWVKDFFNYKKACPLCNKNLKYSLYSSKSRPIELVDNIVKTEINLGPLRKIRNEYKAEIKIDLNTLNFTVDFFDDMGILHETAVPLHKIKSLRTVLNLGSIKFDHKFISDCSCGNYKNESHRFNFLKGKITQSPGATSLERICIRKVDKSELFFVIYNYHLLDKTEVYYGSLPEGHGWSEKNIKKALDGIDPILLPGSLTIPLLKVDILESVVNRLQTLIIFS